MTAKLVGLGIANGSIVYYAKIDAQPETRQTKKSGDVTSTTINSAIAERPGHYEVTFRVNADFSNDAGISFSNVLHLTAVVMDDDQHAPYRSVEDRGARQIAPILRSVADMIEGNLPDFAGRPAPDDPSASS